MAGYPPQLIARLPHWARVAFAARSARVDSPQFERAWAKAPERRLKALADAIDLAERSAAESRPVEGLHESEAEATMAAGAAQVGLHKFRGWEAESPPTDEGAVFLACAAASAARWAAVGAAGSPADSTNAALEAFTWSRDALDAAEDDDALDRLLRDLAALARVARRGGWTDVSPVPPATFDLLDDEPSPRPWWRLW